MENFFIIPETNFDQKGHTIMLLGKNCGSVSNPVVYIFEDPYSEECIKSKPLEIGLKEKIDSNVTFENFYISSLDATAQIAETYGNERTSAIFNYFSCVNVMGKIIDFEKKAYEIYCNTELKSNDPNFLEECKKSPNYGIPLSEIELQQIVLDQNINKQDINTCLSGAKDILGGSKYVANQFNISSVPTVVVNCKYKGHINSLKEMLCEINPKLNICTASK